MILAGTSSKCVGKGSSPNLLASSHAQSMESRKRSISLSAISGSFVEVFTRGTHSREGREAYPYIMLWEWGRAEQRISAALDKPLFYLR